MLTCKSNGEEGLVEIISSVIVTVTSFEGSLSPLIFTAVIM